jgi:hypothetical protein
MTQMSWDLDTRYKSPPLRTLHPEGRGPAAVWFVKQGTSLTLLIHAADGRVALGQVNGTRESVPDRWPFVNPKGTSWWKSGKTERWDVWCRHENDERLDGFTLRRECLRRKFAVPVCHHILAVFPRPSEVVIIHRLKRKGEPFIWRARVGSDPNIPPTFVAAGPEPHGKGKTRPLFGPWIENRWHGTGPLPVDVVRNNCPAIVEVSGGEHRSCETLRMQLVSPEWRPRPLGDDHKTWPVIGRGTSKRSWCSWWTTPPMPCGEIVVDHWTCSLDAQETVLEANRGLGRYSKNMVV